MIRLPTTYLDLALQESVFVIIVFKYLLCYEKNIIFFPTEKGSIIHSSPFKCCLVPNFISDEDFLKGLEKELLQLKFFEKSNDLYKFHQVQKDYSLFPKFELFFMPFLDLLLRTTFVE